MLKQPMFTHFCDKKERIVTDRLVNFVFVCLLIWFVGWLVSWFFHFVGSDWQLPGG